MTTDLYKLPDKDPIPKAKLITVESHDAVFSPEKPLVSNPPLNKNADSDDTAYYADFRVADLGGNNYTGFSPNKPPVLNAMNTPMNQNADSDGNNTAYYL